MQTIKKSMKIIIPKVGIVVVLQGEGSSVYFKGICLLIKLFRVFFYRYIFYLSIKIVLQVDRTIKKVSMFYLKV